MGLYSHIFGKLTCLLLMSSPSSTCYVLGEHGPRVTITPRKEAFIVIELFFVSLFSDVQ